MSALKVAVGPEDHVQGNADAPCTLVEYGDYECPHCAHAYKIVKRVQKHFADRVRFVYRNFPLSEMHPRAEPAAEAAEFAATQGKFWEMHDLLFENQDRLGGELFSELAENLKLDAAALLKAVEQKQFKSQVQADFTGGVRSGVNGTPTFFINGQRHDGSFEYSDLVSAIEATLA